MTDLARCDGALAIVSNSGSEQNGKTAQEAPLSYLPVLPPPFRFLGGIRGGPHSWAMATLHVYKLLYGGRSGANHIFALISLFKAS